MAANLKVIALISGGKDSFFSILHCLQNGHEIVALANLHPPEIDSHTSDDIESYMYQTIGHNLIPLYSFALGLPLYRQPIQGGAINTSKNYSVHPEGPRTSPDDDLHSDETEALIPLLQRIKAAHPSANAISTGAILSDYQRTRIESVASRLGLAPLSYLWQYPFLPPYTQTALLEDISAVGQDSRIIKVASGGLGEEHLWLNVGEPKSISRLARSMGRFGGLQGGAVLGEGGEFETITLDGPAPLWKRRIEVLDGDKSVVVGSGGSCAMRVSDARVVEKDGSSLKPGIGRLRIPELYDQEFAALFCALKTEYGTNFEQSVPLRASIPKYSFIGRNAGSNGTISICNLCGVEENDTTSTAEVQMERIRTKLLAILHAHSLTSDDISSTTILLRSMTDFAAVNKSYGPIFTRPNPPARITISCGDTLPDNVLVMVSVVADRCPPSERRGLHVQSRSYWAPANIGPYSQAIAVPLRASLGGYEDSEIVYVAGQIPLVPASMVIVSDDFAEQAVLALQHLWRIGRTMNVTWWSSAVAVITASSVKQAQERAHLAFSAWAYIHKRAPPPVDDEDDEDEDIGERNLRQPWASIGMQVDDVSTHRWPLPEWEKIDGLYNVVDGSVKSVKPHCFVVQVEELPREAQIEWTSFGFAGTSHISMTESEGASTCNVNDSSYSVQCINLSNLKQLDGFYKDILSKQWQEGALLEIFTPHSVPADVIQRTQALHIPCTSVWSSNGQALHAGIRIRGYDRLKM